MPLVATLSSVFKVFFLLVTLLGVTWVLGVNATAGSTVTPEPNQAPNKVQERQLEETHDLQALAQLARKKQLPILIMFAQDDCLFCELVREDFLNPMLNDTEYNDKVIMRQLHIDSFEEVRNFDGKMIDVEELDVNYGAYLTPTVVFLDPHGYELSPRIIGVVNEFFYGEQLDNAIDNSLRKLHELSEK